VRDKTIAMSDTPLLWSSTVRTDKGCVRSLNEDSVLDCPELGLWVVADGMGGHEAGDYASQQIVKNLSWARQSPTLDGLARDVNALLQRVNTDLMFKAAESSPPRTIGSTVVALLASGAQFICLWAGDSRIYRFRSGRLEQVTRDHSLVQQLVDAGVISAEEADEHPQANVITRAVGAADELDVEAVSGAVEPWDIFLLCSDGLTKMMTDAEIAHSLSQMNIVAAANELLEMTLARGARDNVSLILVQAAPTGDAMIIDDDDTIENMATDE
jgi:serine/threonine protein phosphatase PrpC